jgi:hypothetical protein
MEFRVVAVQHNNAIVLVDNRLASRQRVDEPVLHCGAVSAQSTRSTHTNTAIRTVSRVGVSIQRDGQRVTLRRQEFVQRGEPTPHDHPLITTPHAQRTCARSQAAPQTQTARRCDARDPLDARAECARRQVAACACAR